MALNENPDCGYGTLSSKLLGSSQVCLKHYRLLPLLLVGLENNFPTTGTGIVEHRDIKLELGTNPPSAR